MNTQMLIKTGGFYDPELEDRFSKEADDLLGSLHIQARQDADHSRLKCPEDFSSLVQNKIQTKIQGEIDFNCQVLQAYSGVTVAKKAIGEAKEKVEKLSRQRDDHEQTEEALRREHRRLELQKHRKNLTAFTHTGVWVMALIEGGLNFTALQQVTPFFMALIAAVAIAIALGLVLPISANWIKSGRTPSINIARWVSILLPACVAFGFLGNLRAGAISSVIDLDPLANATAASNPVSGWALACISFTLFLITLAVLVSQTKSESDETLARLHEEKKQEIEEAQRKKELKESQIAKIEEEATGQASIALHVLEYAMRRESSLVSLAYEARSVYIEAYMRNSSTYPQFLHTPPQFSFTLFFHNHQIPKSYE